MRCYYENLWGEGEGLVILGIILTDQQIGLCLFNFAVGIKN